MIFGFFAKTASPIRPVSASGSAAPADCSSPCVEYRYGELNL